MSAETTRELRTLEIPEELKEAVHQQNWEAVSAIFKASRGALRAVLIEVLLTESRRATEASEGQSALRSDTVVFHHQDIQHLHRENLTHALLRKLVDGTLEPTRINAWLEEHERSMKMLKFIFDEKPLV